MSKRTKNTVITVITVIMAYVGFVGYAFEKPGDMIRLVFKTKGGPVVMDHRFHADEEEGHECGECHHTYDPDDPESELTCRKCHFDDPDIAQEACAEAPVHKRCVGKKCVDCHGADDCGYCHIQ